MKANIRNVLKQMGQYFNLLNDKEDEQEVINQVNAAVVFRGTNLWILIFAILIASLGLNVNSTAVIIGAMLVSPLMGPIIGMGLSVGIGDFDLLRRSMKNYAIATLISIVTATVYFLLSPLGEAQSELLARTSPTLFDVLIAFCGGAAGVLALTTKSKGQVIPGVAIATALMPPLCTAGYGLATAQWSYFLGAFYLFFINSVFIALSTFLGVKLLRFHRVSSVDGDRMRYGRRVMTFIVVVTMVPAAFMTWNIVKKNIFERNVESFVNHEMRRNDVQILSSNIEHDTLRIVAVGRMISASEIDDARSRMGYYGLKGVPLSVIQGGDVASMEHLATQMSSVRTAAENRIALLESQLDAYIRYDTLSRQATAEAATLFAPVEQIAIGRVGSGNVALVDLAADGSALSLDSSRFNGWLRMRVQDPSLRIIVVPEL